ncbi:MAG: hypothetical protein LBK76_08720 [Verrucomicrobiales bacterium]|jgi:hypothetical protein|nr:hypothetical protein [Verrucomicrobiales bacterium]
MKTNPTDCWKGTKSQAHQVLDAVVDIIRARRFAEMDNRSFYSLLTEALARKVVIAEIEDMMRSIAEDEQ